jgi:predicted nucleic acid-binding Zn ribbon protein
MMGRSAPRPASLALRTALDRSAPRTGLAAAQTVWPEAVGEAIAAVAEPVAERDGVLTVRCQSATWAEELSLMESELLGRLGERLGERSPSALKLLAG